MNIDLLKSSNPGNPIGLGQFDQAALEALLRDGYKLTPATLSHKVTRGKWIPARHLLHISTQIATAIRKGGQFIIVTMPPRHGKSELLSVGTPIWFLENWPEQRVALASYGADLATEFALKVRDTFNSEDNQQLLTCRIRRDRQRLDNFKTTEGGGMLTTGIGGSLTGKGANLLLIDDYVKNAEEALSDAQKDKAWQWFLSTAFTRLEPNATIIMLATRWDKKDLIGMVLELWVELEKAGFDPPVIINLPAFARPNDPLGRAVGEPLWPERYDMKALQRIKATLGTYWFNALYQQDPPSSLHGAMLGDKLKIIPRDKLPHASRRQRKLRIWDFAGTPDGGDWSVGKLMSLDSESGKVYIEDLVRERVHSGSLQVLVRQVAELDGPGVKVWIDEEPASAGKMVVEHYQREVLPEFAVQGEKPTGPIEVRAQPYLAAIERGDVFMVEAPWNTTVREEINAFPGGDFDDCVATGALGYRKLCRGRFGGVVWGGAQKGKKVVQLDPTVKRRVGVVW
jgi:predicted phage terminase large subunit-like protein